MLPIVLPNAVFNHFLLELQCLQLKAAVREGTLIIEAPGDHTTFALSFRDDENSEQKSQTNRTPLQGKANHPFKCIEQPSISCLNDLHNVNQTFSSESIYSTSMSDCALDLTKSTSVSSSTQKAPEKGGTEEVNGMMKIFQLNLFPSTSLPLFQPIATNSTMSSGIRFGPYSVASSPVKQRRVGETLVPKPYGYRQYRCNQCDYIFDSIRNLELHTLETHGGYKCHLCKKPFTQRSNLQRHALKHVDFKPFECILCGKAYYRKDHLMRHMQKMHPLHPAEENIQVKLRTSESLDYLRQTRGEDFLTTPDLRNEGSRSENCLTSEDKGVEVGETDIRVDDTNSTKSSVKSSTDFLSKEGVPPTENEFPLLSSPH
ncbi:unnamed protein product [Rodentolepis nana]|uniref:Zinc finger protein n=1 Tax=Rodentolepis nana TaxID=102285 RepID=A0A0R3TSP9_RODNA|nr:unnamed protein product [Rodentolepis nana]